MWYKTLVSGNTVYPRVCGGTRTDPCAVPVRTAFSALSVEPLNETSRMMMAYVGGGNFQCSLCRAVE